MLALRSIFRIYDYIISGQYRRQGPPWISWIFIGATLSYGVGRSLRWLYSSFSARAVVCDPNLLVVVFLTFNIVYSALVTIVLSHGDHNRYRDSFSGYYLILFTLLLDRVIPVRSRDAHAGEVSSAKLES